MNIIITEVTILSEKKRRECAGHGLVQLDFGKRSWHNFPEKMAEEFT